MTTISFQWQIEHLDTIDDKGRPMSRVTEAFTDDEVGERIFHIPSVLADSLIRARRAYVQRLMWRHGGIKLLLH